MNEEGIRVPAGLFIFLLICVSLPRMEILVSKTNALLRMFSKVSGMLSQPDLLFWLFIEELSVALRHKEGDVLGAQKSFQRILVAKAQSTVKRS